MASFMVAAMERTVTSRITACFGKYHQWTFSFSFYVKNAVLTIEVLKIYPKPLFMFSKLKKKKRLTSKAEKGRALFSKDANTILMKDDVSINGIIKRVSLLITQPFLQNFYLKKNTKT